MASDCYANAMTAKLEIFKKFMAAPKSTKGLVLKHFRLQYMVYDFTALSLTLLAKYTCLAILLAYITSEKYFTIQYTVL